ncbi:DUF4282 domain-containing protein [Williamsia sp.]|uniref:DUF4282 domain-containing protein n=1 Tax=Williamsia sp. TaxID=1872085 RepID=UPI002F948A27
MTSGGARTRNPVYFNRSDSVAITSAGQILPDRSKSAGTEGSAHKSNPTGDQSQPNPVFEPGPRFTQFVTLRLVVISIVAVIYFFVALIGGFAAFGEDDGAAVGVLLILVALVVVPLFWLIYVVLSRVIYEFFLSIVRIAENTDPRNRRM